MSSNPGKHDSVQGSIVRVVGKVNKYLSKGEPQVVQLQTLRKQLTTYWDTFYDLQVAVEAASGCETIEEQQIIQATTEDLYMDALISLDVALTAIAPRATGPSTSSAPPAPTSVVVTTDALPRQEIPKFDSTYEGWPSFNDLFSTIVISNARLTGAQRLQYLKQNVRGDAEQLLRQFHTTSENFEVAWEALRSRYENQRVIATTHLRRLFRQSSLQSESAVGLRKLLDTTNECVSSLRLLGIPTVNWDPLLVFLVTDRLDIETRRQFEIAHPGTNLITFAQLNQFLENRFRSLEATSSAPARRQSVVTKVQSHTATAQFSDKRLPHGTSCGYCNDNHRTSNCPTYLSLGHEDKLKLIRERGWCYNCLGKDHSNKKCPSKFNCRHCNRKHHSSLHEHEPTQGGTHPPPKNTPEISHGATAMTTQIGTQRATVLLSTVSISIMDAAGNWHTARALLDIGAQASFISQALARKLRLQGRPAALSVHGIGTSSQSYTITFQSSRIKTIPMSVETFEIKTVTTLKYDITIDQNQCTELSNLTLADPNFMTSGPIDILLGAEIYGTLIQPGLIKLGCGLTAQNTELGWVVFGPHFPQPSPPKRSTPALSVASLHVRAEDETLNRILCRFWEVEDCRPSTPPLTSEQQWCEQHFAETYTRTADGRFVVRLPFLPQTLPLMGTSRQGALSRLVQMERRFLRDETLHQKYIHFMDEYVSSGHMSVTNLPESRHQEPFYLPHHAVLGREGKIRVVFDGSHKSTSGVSLNDVLAVGPTIQSDLVTNLLRWRNHKYVFTADIVKMYRQILIDDRDTIFQHILWRSDTRQPILDYTLKTVTYGTSSAPFLAVRALKQLARDDGKNYPQAATAIENDFYVDDIMTGGDELSMVIALRDQLITLLARGGFSLSKWASNYEDVLANISTELLKSPNEQQIIEQNQPIKTLGLLWTPQEDCFRFRIDTVYDATVTLTKRGLLSQIGRLFDPLGWLAPVVVVAKTLFQRLWLLPLSWDDELPAELVTEWNVYRTQLPSLENIKIPRWTHRGSSDTFELHGFCDSSTTAYAAVIYSRTIDNFGQVRTTLLTSKTRVAPVKQLSIPRLELCGASLLATLMSRVKESLGEAISREFCWCDSTIVLAWLRKEPSHWQTFVANRVSNIQTQTSPSNWRHVPSTQNPADCASRGLYPDDLCRHDLWWNGPSFLLDNPTEWPIFATRSNTDLEEKRGKGRVQAHIAQALEVTLTEFELITRYSSLSRLRRITALILRFAANCRAKNESRIFGPIRTIELDTALRVCIQICQALEFAKEIASSAKGCALPKASPLISLRPFLDSRGILRVGGRLQRSQLSYNRQHQIILPRTSHLTMLMVDDIHRNSLHGGTQLVLTILRQRYWIVSARQYVRHRIHQCITCFRQKRATESQLMGTLPSERVNPARPFIKCGVDYAGPITLKSYKGRCTRLLTGYIVVFVCMATRAIHLEAASDLSTPTFIATFRRFVSRRGHCTDVYSDNGTNFVGAEKELKALLMDVQRREAQLADTATQWHFNPPGAPHFGGMWEAGVRSVKHHLSRVIGTTNLTFEELSTVLTQIEACLNSRPLYSLSDDPMNFEVLTPGHFIIGEPLLPVPGRDFTSTPVNYLIVGNLSKS